MKADNTLMDFVCAWREDLRCDENKACITFTRYLWHSGYLIGYFLYCNYTARIEKQYFLQTQNKNLNVI